MYTPGYLRAVITLVGQDTLTGTKDVAVVVGATSLGHRHVVLSYLGIAADVDIAVAAALVFQRIGHSHLHLRMLCVVCCIGYVIPAHRGDLAATIDTMPNLCIACNVDVGMAANQRGIAMGHHALTGTIHIFHYNRRACASCGRSVAHAYRDRSVLFYTAHLAAAIDGAVDRTVTDGHIRGTGHHGLAAAESTSQSAIAGVCSLTLAAAEHVAANGDFVGRKRDARIVVSASARL